MRFENTVKGAKALMNHAGDVHYVFESTGGYERLAAWLLLAADGIVSVVNPGRVREYAKSMGQLAKTDRIDARIIAEYAAVASPKPATLPSADQRKLSVLVDRRQQIMEMRVAEHNRLDTAGEPYLRQMIQKHLRWLEKQIDKLEEEIAQTIQTNPSMREKVVVQHRCLVFKTPPASVR